MWLGLVTHSWFGNSGILSFLGVLGVDPFYSVILLYGRIYTVWYGNYSVRI